jgi:hypothetical protein
MDLLGELTIAAAPGDDEEALEAARVAGFSTGCGGRLGRGRTCREGK